MFPDAVQPIATTASSSAFASLESGQAISGKVEEFNGALTVVAGMTRIPLPENAPLSPGQDVTVTVTQTPEGPRLMVAPQDNTQPPAQQQASPPLRTALNAILESLGNIDSQSARAIVPTALPPDAALVRSILSLFVSNGAAGDDLTTLAALLQEAVEAGVTPPETLNDILGFLIPSMAADAGDFKDFLRRIASDNEKSLEARLASAIASGDANEIEEALSQGLRGQIARLRDDPALMAFLKAEGSARAFQQAADNVLERLSSSLLQNLHGQDHNYLFIELLFAPGGAIRYGQIHLLGDQRDNRGQPGTSNAMVALDLSTTRLGDLWITLNATGKYCSCRFLAATPEVARLIDDAAHELAAALEQAGFQQASVTVGIWDGNRLTQTARLLGQFSGLNVQA